MGATRASGGPSPTVPLGEYLSPAGLAQLKAYKYVSAPLNSFVDQKMTYFWEFVVNLMPMWLAYEQQQQQQHRERQNLTAVGLPIDAQALTLAPLAPCSCSVLSSALLQTQSRQRQLHPRKPCLRVNLDFEISHTRFLAVFALCL